MAGWWLGVSFLYQPIPNAVPMQFNTALWLSLLAASVIWNGPIRRVCVWAVLLMAALTALSYTPWEIVSVDQLFHRHEVTTNTISPGRPSPLTVLAAILSALSLYPPFGSVVRGSIAACVTGIGAVGAFGYLLGIPEAYSVVGGTDLAVHTSAGFMLLGQAIMLDSSAEAAKERRSTAFWSVLSGTLVGVFLILTLVAMASGTSDKVFKYALCVLVGIGTAFSVAQMVYWPRKFRDEEPRFVEAMIQEFEKAAKQGRG